MSEQRNYQVTFHLPEGLVKIHTEGAIEVLMASGKHLQPAELAVIATTSELMQRLRTGKLATYKADPLSFEDASRLTKCEWLKSGNLKVHGDTDKVYHFVMTKEDALKERRTFTCAYSLVALLPKKRVSILGVTGFPLGTEDNQESSEDGTGAT